MWHMYRYLFSTLLIILFSDGAPLICGSVQISPHWVWTVYQTQKDNLSQPQVFCDPEPSPVTWLFVSILQEKLPKTNLFEGTAAEGNTSLHGLSLNPYNLLDIEKCCSELAAKLTSSSILSYQDWHLTAPLAAQEQSQSEMEMGGNLLSFILIRLQTDLC